MRTVDYTEVVSSRSICLPRIIIGSLKAGLDYALEGLWLSKRRNYNPHTIADYDLTFRCLRQFLSKPERRLRPLRALQLVQMSAILGQSIDYCIGEDPRLTQDEHRLLALYRHARSKGLADLLLRLAEAIADRKP